MAGLRQPAPKITSYRPCPKYGNFHVLSPRQMLPQLITAILRIDLVTTWRRASLMFSPNFISSGKSGRSAISSDHALMGGLRLKPVCSATGEAAGVATKRAVRSGPTRRNIAGLHLSCYRYRNPSRSNRQLFLSITAPFI